MRIIYRSISNTDLFKIIDESSQQTYYGCNQTWYATKWQRLAGCGPSAASNIIYYLSHNPAVSNSAQRIGKETYLMLMKEMWKYVTPTLKGVSTTKRFYKGVLSYADSKGQRIQYASCDLPKKKMQRPPFPEVLHFVETGITQDIPVAFLNLCNGEVENFDRWHWVTIISLEYTEDGNSAFVSVLDEGVIKKIDLALWYNTTTLGGGFVYFTPLPIDGSVT